jgi:hypothetical protein
VIWDKHADLTEPLFSQIPVLAGVGNHDDEFGSFEAYHFRWRHPKDVANLYWFSHIEGPVQTFSLSSEHEISPGSAQYEWLESVLEEANEPMQRQQVPWVVGMIHRPPYTSGIHREKCAVPAIQLSTSLAAEARCPSCAMFSLYFYQPSSCFLLPSECSLLLVLQPQADEDS